MKKFLLTPFLALLATSAFAADPDYRTVHLEIDIAKPATEVWSKVGGYCDIKAWLNLDCTLTSGTGDVGTVRSLAGGRVLEVLVGKTPLSYGYAIHAKPTEFDSFYHGFMEARPVSSTASKIIYTLIYDVSDKADSAAKEADVTRRRGMFENALKNMKKIAEGG